jgi:hypothetical protein
MHINVENRLAQIMMASGFISRCKYRAKVLWYFGVQAPLAKQAEPALRL